uniref:Uncharacterized protein n=1 Tax=uncultured Desulfobacterium sp. TaxID=201089 RepID=E1YLN1_9BACT|nr:unknown protein [uncultured Desulfobacterium sp.]
MPLKITPASFLIFIVLSFLYKTVWLWLSRITQKLPWKIIKQLIMKPGLVLLINKLLKN